MIAANELRIGNLVNYSVNGEPLHPGKITGLYNTEDDSKKGIIDYHYPLSFGHPIPLTPEILIACGFKYFKSDGISSFEDGASDPDGVTHCWEINIKRSDFVESHSISLVKWGEQDDFTFQLERGFYRQQIKYVHTLQNLFYFLSGGKELEIKL